jgi:hypothetical protein
VEGSTVLDRVVSPRVVATYVTRGPRLALLVLWRGSPGWFRGDGSAGGTSRSTAAGGFYDQILTVVMGDVTLKVEIHHTDGTAQILGRTIQLDLANTVLVDGVDSPSGPEIVSVGGMDPALTKAPDPLPLLFARTPQLDEFLRCDDVMPDLGALSGFSTVCHRLTGR